MKLVVFCPRCDSKLVVSEHVEDGALVVRMVCVGCKVEAAKP